DYYCHSYDISLSVLF
nr:immunoglobulin light chain junction region [Macaca mulatta]